MTRALRLAPARLKPLRLMPTRIAPGRAPLSNRRFSTALTLGAAALAMVLAAALPGKAQAEGKDLAKALVGALVVGAIIHEATRDKPAPEPAHGRDGHAGPDRPGKGPRRHDQPRIPDFCAIEIDGDRRSVALYPESCLRREGFAAPLPRHCATAARIFGRNDRVYGADCLAGAGFDLEGRRRH